MYIERVEVFVHQTRLRGMFNTGGEVYTWFGKNVLRRLIPEARSELRPGRGIRTGRMSRSLRARIRGTNQYLLSLEMETTAEHAIHYIFPTGPSFANQAMGVDSPLTYPNPNPHSGGPTVLRVGAQTQYGYSGRGRDRRRVVIRAGGGRSGYGGHNFLDDAMTSVLRKRRLL